MNWVELPRHLNMGLEALTTDWCLKIDIDQFIHEHDFEQIRWKIKDCPKEIDVLTLEKVSMTYGGKYYQKGPIPVVFRNKDYIRIGKKIGEYTDLCFPIRVIKHEKVEGYDLPCGTSLTQGRMRNRLWNYDYFFKTKRFTKRELWRFSRAYHRFFGEWTFGSNSEEAFKRFLAMMEGRHDRSPYDYTNNMYDHPKYIRNAVKNLKPSQFGYDGFGMLNS